MNNLGSYGKKIYSQNNEDGITLRIIELIGHKINKFFWEFGVEDGKECNTRILRDKWDGVILDGGYENYKINLFREIITWSNILELIKKYEIPRDLGLLSIDTDYNDAYLARRLLTKITPSIVIAEYNIGLGLDDKTVVHDPEYFWDYSTYYGCSALCLSRIYKDYILVYANKVNLFFIHKTLCNYKQKPLDEILPLEAEMPKFKADYFHRHWVSSKEVNDGFVKKTIAYTQRINKELNKIGIFKLRYFRRKKLYREFENEVKRIKKIINKKIPANKRIIDTLISNRLSIGSKN